MKYFLTLLSLFFGINAWAAPNLVGVWRTECTPFTRHSFVTTASFSEDKVILITQLYADSACTTNSITMTCNGAYSVGDAFGDGFEINQNPSSIKLTIHLQEVVDHFNSVPMDGCGISDWRLDIPREITGRYCRPNQYPLVGQILYDICNITREILKFGSLPVQFVTEEAFRAGRLSQVNFHRI